MKQPLRDNAYTLIGQVRDNRPGFSKADAESILMPTLFVGGAKTKGLLPKVLQRHDLVRGVVLAGTNFTNLLELLRQKGLEKYL